jgi:cytochrome c
MKKVLGIILTGVIIVSCGEGKHTPIQNSASDKTTTGTTETSSEKSSETTSNTTTTTTAVTTSNAATATSTVAPATDKKEDFSKGMQLIANSDCLTCHKLNEKVIGPAYKDVAKKYAYTPANVKMLAGKIIKGGAGNWGSIPMTAHASLSPADAELMVKYILNLK